MAGRARGDRPRAKTIASIHGLVSSIMSDGIAHRPPVCDHNPFASRLRESPDVRVEEMVFLTPAEFALIHRNVPAFYQLLALLLSATGLRLGKPQRCASPTWPWTAAGTP